MWTSLVFRGFVFCDDRFLLQTAAERPQMAMILWKLHAILPHLLNKVANAYLNWKESIKTDLNNCKRIEQYKNW